MKELGDAVGGVLLTQKSDVAIIGAGLVGLATAYSLKQAYPKLTLQILEKESDVAAHQSSHNSGVLHTGIYYKPGSLKAKNCLVGKKLLEEFCQKEGVPFQTCGKVIVATETAQIPALERIFQRGIENGVRCEMLQREQLLEIEPHVDGIRAISVPEAGIIDFLQVAKRLRTLLEAQEVYFHFHAEVAAISNGSTSLRVVTSNGDFETRFLINCAGLHSDRILRMTGTENGVRIIPFRGEYYELTEASTSLCRSLIYPVPDPAFPFLGVHLTRTINNSVECGPNAVLSFAREGYSKFSFNLRDTIETFGFSGFRTFAARHLCTGLRELHRSFRKDAFVHALQKLVPAITEDSLVPGGAGVRAQAIDAAGNLLDDFVLSRSERMLHVLNAPSPAATSCLSIGRELCAMAHDELAAL